MAIIVLIIFSTVLIVSAGMFSSIDNIFLTEYNSNNLLSAKRTIDTGASGNDTSSFFQPETTDVGRPKYNITEEQLRFFIGKFTN